MIAMTSDTGRCTRPNSACKVDAASEGAEDEDPTTSEMLGMPSTYQSINEDGSGSDEAVRQLMEDARKQLMYVMTS